MFEKMTVKIRRINRQIASLPTLLALVPITRGFLNADFTKVILKIKNHLEFINVKLNRTDFNIVEIL